KVIVGGVLSVNFATGLDVMSTFCCGGTTNEHVLPITVGQFDHPWNTQPEAGVATRSTPWRVVEMTHGLGHSGPGALVTPAPGGQASPLAETLRAPWIPGTPVLELADAVAVPAPAAASATIDASRARRSPRSRMGHSLLSWRPAPSAAR